MTSKDEKYWSDLATTYDRDAEYIFGHEIHEIIKQKLLCEDNFKSTVEFGCGTGIYSKTIASNATSLVATDLSQEMINVAHSRLKDLNNVITKTQNCLESTFPAESFDTVIMTNVFQLLSTPQKSLEENFRILKPDGRLIIITYTLFGTKFTDALKLIYRLISTINKPPANLRVFTPNKLKVMVENAHFKVLESGFIGDKFKAIYLKAHKANDS